jgi:hypothetical protein
MSIGRDPSGDIRQNHWLQNASSVERAAPSAR